MKKGEGKKEKIKFSHGVSGAGTLKKGGNVQNGQYIPLRRYEPLSYCFLNITLEIYDTIYVGNQKSCSDQIACFCFQ